MTYKDSSKWGLVLLLLLVVLVSCSNDCALATPQELHPSSGLRREMRGVKASYSRPAGHGTRGRAGGIVPLPPLLPPLLSPPPPPLPTSSMTLSHP